MMKVSPAGKVDLGLMNRDVPNVVYPDPIASRLLGIGQESLDFR